jgi:GTPase SAR1 family protein
VIVFLVGTQVDKEDARVVTTDQAKEFVETHGLDYFIETSAKTNFNIEKLFTVAAQKLYVKYKVKNMLGDTKAIISGENPDNVKLDRTKDYAAHKKKKGCA